MRRSYSQVRVVITIWVWIAYLLAFNFYILTFGMFNIVYSYLINLTSGFLTLLFCTVSLLSENTPKQQIKFIALCLAGMCANFVLLIVYYCIGLNNYQLSFCAFNGVELVTALFIFTSGCKHGLFNTE